MTYIRRTALEIAVFLCGAVVMIYEIIGSRLVSPYIGGSIYIWTSLIGVILGSLSLGYWLGGRLADKKPDIRHLASIIFAAAALIAITTLVKDVFLAAIASAAMILEIKAVIASLVLFAPASIFLGMVTPYAIKLKMLSLYESGRTVGNLYALSTIGSIVGTFSAGFFHHCSGFIRRSDNAVSAQIHGGKYSGVDDLCRGHRCQRIYPLLLVRTK
jgi:predicted membrane-bound spermidine synthase